MSRNTRLTLRKTWSAMAALAFLIGLAGNAHATGGSAPTSWTLTSGTASWTSANWSNSVPTSTGTAYLNNEGTAEVATGVSGVAAYLYMGSTGTGNLLVNGGYLSSSNTYIGAGATGTSTATVTSGTFANSTLSVGSSSAGVLNIRGGYVTSRSSSYIGDLGQGTVTVSGGTWATLNGSGLRIGNQAEGTLNIINNGVVKIGGAIALSLDPSATATINIGTGGTAGTLNVGEINAYGGTATINFNHTNTTTLGANLGGEGAMTVNKLGSGTTTLTGASTFSGTTNVTGGRLNVDGSLSTNSTVSVQSGGTVGGSGTIGRLSGQGGTIAVDSGMLTAEIVSLDSTTTLELQIGSTLVVTTSLSLGGTLNLSGLDSLTISEFPTLLIDLASGITADNAFATILASGSAVTIVTTTGSTTTFTTISNKTYMINFNAGTGNDVTVESVDAVPEPATWAMVLGGIGALALLRRKRA